MKSIDRQRTEGRRKGSLSRLASAMSAISTASIAAMPDPPVEDEAADPDDALGTSGGAGAGVALRTVAAARGLEGSGWVAGLAVAGASG